MAVGVAVGVGVGWWCVVRYAPCWMVVFGGLVWEGVCGGEGGVRFYRRGSAFF